MIVWGGYDSSYPGYYHDTGGVYDPGVSHALTVTRNGTGSGSVSSSPAGISCGADCAEDYDPGISVTLMPAPGTGSSFTSWSGDCIGAGACGLTMDAAKSVTATFDLTSGTGFYTLPPCRVVDTRFADGPALAANTTRTFAVAGPLCGVPGTAKAVAVNVTVTGETHAGSLSLYAAGSERPPARHDRLRPSRHASQQRRGPARNGRRDRRPVQHARRLDPLHTRRVGLLRVRPERR
jgi:hypothetical protein